MTAAPAMQQILIEPTSARLEIEQLRLEVERLRGFIEARTKAQEDMARAMACESVARALEAVEGRVQLAAREAMAFAEQGLEQHEAALRALGRRLAALTGAGAPAPAEPPGGSGPPAATAAYRIGAGGGADDCRILDVGARGDEAFVAELASLPILPGGASKLVAAHVVEYAPAAALAELILPHWRSRLAPGGELVVVTLDGPAFVADLARGDFARQRERLGADGAARPLRNLLDAHALRRALVEAGLSPGEPTRGQNFALTVVARRAAT